jgi:hypothetical protein
VKSGKTNESWGRMGMSFDCLKKVIIDFVEYIDENE